MLKLGKYPANSELQEAAGAYFKSIKNPTDFQIQKYGEVLIDLRRFPEAETILRGAGKLDADAFLNYRLSQAMLGQGKTNEALAAIELALGCLKDNKFRASFLDQRFLCRKSDGDPLAVEDLDAAIAVSQPGRYLDTLKRRRAEES